MSPTPSILNLYHKRQCTQGNNCFQGTVVSLKITSMKPWIQRHRRVHVTSAVSCREGAPLADTFDIGDQAARCCPLLAEACTLELWD